MAKYKQDLPKFIHEMNRIRTMTPENIEVDSWVTFWEKWKFYITAHGIKMQGGESNSKELMTCDCISWEHNVNTPNHEVYVTVTSPVNRQYNMGYLSYVELDKVLDALRRSINYTLDGEANDDN